jgi:excisionase family DNA binding protein
MTKRQPIGAYAAIGDSAPTDELTRLIRMIAREAAQEAFIAFREALDLRIGDLAAPSDPSRPLEQPPECTAAKTPSYGPDERFLSVAEVAERLGLSVKTVRRKITAGELTAHRLGRLLRVGERGLAACLAPARRRGNNSR